MYVQQGIVFFFFPIPIQSLFWKTHFKEDPENFMTISILTCPFQHHTKHLSWYLVSFTIGSNILGFNRVFVFFREGGFFSGHQQSTVCMASDMQWPSWPEMFTSETDSSGFWTYRSGISPVTEGKYVVLFFNVLYFVYNF